MYVSPETEAVWDAFERRNPGVAHPDRVKHKHDEARRVRSQEYADATDTWTRRKTVAELAAASHRHQRGF